MVTKRKLIVAASLVLAAFVTGCSAFTTLNERAVSADDVIKMSSAGIGADVIIRQIEVTRSRFELTPNDIIRLKESGVDEKVLTVMIETKGYPPSYDNGYGYDYYDSRFDYYHSWYPVAMHYPYPYRYYRPYITYRRDGLLGRFYREVPVTTPPYRVYDRRNNPERRDQSDDDDDN